MAVHFSLDTCGMTAEVEKSITSREPELLHSLCRSCVYGFFEYILPEECRTCSVGQGIKALPRRMGKGDDHAVFPQRS
jgi:hypothetical protein